MSETTALLQGTLDLLILKAVSLGPLHGYGVLLRIQQISQNRLQIQQGSLYPALYRLKTSSQRFEPVILLAASNAVKQALSPLFGFGAAAQLPQAV